MWKREREAHVFRGTFTLYKTVYSRVSLGDLYFSFLSLLPQCMHPAVEDVKTFFPIHACVLCCCCCRSANYSLSVSLSATKQSVVESVFEFFGTILKLSYSLTMECSRCILRDCSAALLKCMQKEGGIFVLRLHAREKKDTSMHISQYIFRPVCRRRKLSFSFLNPSRYLLLLLDIFASFFL